MHQSYDGLDIFLSIIFKLSHVLYIFEIVHYSLYMNIFSCNKSTSIKFRSKPVADITSSHTQKFGCNKYKININSNLLCEYFCYTNFKRYTVQLLLPYETCYNVTIFYLLLNTVENKLFLFLFIVSLFYPHNKNCISTYIIRKL